MLRILACLLPLLFGFLLPVGLLTRHAIRYFEESWTPDFAGYALNSLMLSVSAAVLTLIIGVLLSYAKRLDRTASVQQALKLSSLGYAMPGAVLGLGVLVPLSGFDNALDSFLRANFGFSSGLLLTGTMGAIIISQKPVIGRSPLPVGPRPARPRWCPSGRTSRRPSRAPRSARAGRPVRPPSSRRSPRRCRGGPSGPPG